jgi:hypothetical protein
MRSYTLHSVAACGRTFTGREECTGLQCHLAVPAPYICDDRYVNMAQLYTVPSQSANIFVAQGVCITSIAARVRRAGGALCEAEAGIFWHAADGSVWAQGKKVQPSAR